METTAVTDEENAACSAAADESQAALNAWILKTYKGGDERAARNLNFAINEDH